MALEPRDRTYLGREGATLGRGAVAGAQVWDRQSKFRLQLGPLTLGQYEAFLPGGTLIQKLVDWVRLYLCFELEWDVRLVLAQERGAAAHARRRVDDWDGPRGSAAARPQQMPTISASTRKRSPVGARSRESDE